MMTNFYAMTLTSGVVNEGGGCKATVKRMSVRRSRMHDSECKAILLATNICRLADRTQQSEVHIV